MPPECNYILTDRKTTRWRKYVLNFIPSETKAWIAGDPSKSSGNVLADGSFAYDW
jgi:hypothetical protein